VVDEKNQLCITAARVRSLGLDDTDAGLVPDKIRCQASGGEYPSNFQFTLDKA
jgi:hypothetical protein